MPGGRGASICPYQRAETVHTGPFSHLRSSLFSTLGLLMYQWARTHLRSLNVGLPAQEKKRDTYLHVATVMLSLEVSSGNILSKELILLRSCAPGALWIGPCRIPPDSKFQTASRAFLPNTLGSFPGSSLGLALLPPT